MAGPAAEPLFELTADELVDQGDVELEIQTRRVERQSRLHTPETRAGLAPSRRLGPRRRSAVGSYLYTHPDVPGRSFSRRDLAAQAAVEERARQRELVSGGPERMTSSQRWALEGADEDGVLRRVDGRIMPSLVKRGWAVETRRLEGRRQVTVWHLTIAGEVARDNALVVEPAARPDWLDTWRRERLGPGRYLVEGHELLRPSPSMLWRVLCPQRRTGPDEPEGLVAYRETLAEAVDRLRHHLFHEACGPSAVDLDQVR